jgi:hypothetical protein
MTVESAEVSGKVFRFLSAMHPALSKSERKRYAGFDPDKWYVWTPEISAEFTELMRRSPRDASFARGFAYVAQRAMPEGGYVPTRVLFESLDRLPAAFRSAEGSGFVGRQDRPGHAVVSYSGMPGFANVCIAIQGEIMQRVQASGAQSVVVRHAPTCRVNGATHCEFEVEWSGEVPPPNAYAVDPKDLGVELESPAPAAAVVDAPRASIPAAASAPPTRTMQNPNPASPIAIPPTPTTQPSSLSSELSGEDLFVQLRKRLSEADRQSRLYHDAQAEIERLRLELARVRAQADAEIAAAVKERDDAIASEAELKRRVRAMVADE